MTHSCDDDAESAAQAMVTRFVEAWIDADGSVYGDGYWKDAELVDPSGRIWSGREAIVQTHLDLWSGIFHSSRISGSTRRIHRLGADVLIVDVDLDLINVRGFHRGPPTTLV